MTGADSLIWGSDYPHLEGTYPHSREVVQRLARDISADDARKVFRDNAAKLFNFDVATIELVTA
ncbi:MAG: amidohydrolase family protein [Actinobacteria bacterium]|uniref:Unannotated protein n=1 Tax=freshwater metagenome TaxID=449393 RepID=A0A6J7RXA9_9ZZZZ|nr:amidohydrolase family protein [Actinomycetota bacterium]MTB27080.1 amidohydrolase family protein [Actinomycetota bacterium]